MHSFDNIIAVSEETKAPSTPQKPTPSSNKDSAESFKSYTLPPLESQVQLRDPFNYNAIFFTISMLLLIAIVIFEIIRLILHRKPVETKTKEKKPVVVTPPPKTLYAIKQEYLNKLMLLEQNLPNMTVRKSYQELSIILRMFIFEATGIKVQNYSLQEIAALRIQYLTMLVQEYYTPEFAYESRGDVRSSIQKSRQLIWRWM